MNQMAGRTVVMDKNKAKSIAIDLVGIAVTFAFILPAVLILEGIKLITQENGHNKVCNNDDIID